MSRAVITHAVEDIDVGCRARRNALLPSNRVPANVTDHVAHDGSNNIAITADVSDLATLQSMLASPPPDVLAAMEAHGVIQPISRRIRVQSAT
jgi:hypothetical protein